LWTNEVECVIIELLLRKSLTAKAEAQHCDICRVVAYDQRRRDSSWKLQKHGLRDSGHLGDAGRDVGARLEKNFYHRDSIERFGFDMFDVIDRLSQFPFVDRSNIICDRLRLHARISPNNGNYRNVDTREDIFRCPQNRQPSAD
jgi:hypothetical protein